MSPSLRLRVVRRWRCGAFHLWPFKRCWYQRGHEGNHASAKPGVYRFEWSQ